MKDDSIRYLLRRHPFTGGIIILILSPLLLGAFGIYVVVFAVGVILQATYFLAVRLGTRRRRSR